MSTMQERVAVITRTKNRALILGRAVESVLGQTYQNWIHVIVNDGGEAEPVEKVLAPYKARYGDRLMVIHNPESLGMEGASNKGITACESTYVTIHDDDDTWEPEFLETCVRTLQGTPFPSIKGVVTHTNQIFERVDDNGAREVSRRDFDPWLVSVSLPEITEINKFMPISFLFRREVFDVIGLFDESLPVIGDWEFNIRFLSKFDVIVVKDRLANYHIRVEGNADYANTVTAGRDRHLFYRDLIVNKHLRADLEAGRVSMGMLMAWGDYFHRLGGNTWRLVQVVERLKSVAPLRALRKVLRV
ncbi:glycosyltransferase family 2 protein [Alloalcanivorax sp. C16-1]|uniref:glycosyltransferase family 2 protein n=1 Tax=Alloalcanivorax sp. C16-1 TaxID=3390051 RepID=UPI003970BFF7